MIQNRRSFIKNIAAGSAMFASGILVQPVFGKSNDLYVKFKNPTAQARPFFRWWWNGNRVTAEEIKREINLMKRAGAGGVEINPVCMHEEVEYPPEPELTWLSREWNDMVNVAADENKRLGMHTDLIVGTGWPFGGKFLNDDETIKGLDLETECITGPHQWIKTFEFGDPENRKLFQLRLVPENFKSLDEIADLLPSVANNSITYDIPPGKWTIHSVIWKNKFREVMHGTKGADGPALDHFNKAAVEKYLNRMSDALNPGFVGKLGEKFRSLFCDSIELMGANWTNGFAEQFQTRRGYDLLPYLSFLLDSKLLIPENMQETFRRVRYDYSLTMAELFMEGFIIPFQQWCTDNKSLCRYQAYGFPWLYTDLLDGYMIPDIPESDQWLYNNGWMHRVAIDKIRYATWNKYASSGAHLAGRKIASCEAMTNTSGVFEGTLEYMKQATDLNIVGGINHMVLHGFNYSPPHIDFPGYIRYGGYFSEHNTWWPFAKNFMDYAARLSQIFQDSDPVSQVAIFGPTPDIWNDYGLDRNPWILNPPYLHELWQAFSHNGVQTDYVNSTILKNAKFKKGQINYGDISYQLLVMADVKSIEPAVAVSLDDYAKAGGKIVFVNSLPHRSPGFSNFEENDQIVKNTIENLVKNNPQNVRQISYDVNENLVQWATNLVSEFNLKPSVKISNPDERLFTFHKKQGKRQIYFFCNSHRDKTVEFYATFPTGKKIPWRWDAMTGQRAVYPFGKYRNRFPVNLSPLESLVLVFEPKENGPQTVYKMDTERNNPLYVSGEWDVTLKSVDGKIVNKKMDRLEDISKEHPDFSGTITFTLVFDSFLTDGCLLDLGDVNDIAEVKLNRHDLGVSWCRPHQFDICKKLQTGKNKLEIKVTNVLFNYCRSLQENQVTQYWTKRSRTKSPLPTGLVGPIKIY